jgi:hypothetical protein
LAHRLHVSGSAQGTVGRMVLWDRRNEVGHQRASEWTTASPQAVEAVDSLAGLGKARPQWVVTCLPTSADVAEVANALVPHLVRSDEPIVWIDCTSGLHPPSTVCPKRKGSLTKLSCRRPTGEPSAGPAAGQGGSGVRRRSTLRWPARGRRRHVDGDGWRRQGSGGSSHAHHLRICARDCPRRWRR